MSKTLSTLLAATTSIIGAGTLVLVPMSLWSDRQSPETGVFGSMVDERPSTVLASAVSAVRQDRLCTRDALPEPVAGCSYRCHTNLYGCQICRQICDDSSAEASVSCKRESSCESGQDSCPTGTTCSGAPSYGCYPSACASPMFVAKGTYIATPDGNKRIETIGEGTVVWSMNENGEKVESTITSVIASTQPPTDSMTLVVLADGRQLLSSPGQELADGRTIGELRLHDSIDGVAITTLRKEPYPWKEAYDIKPDSETGTYWANGILVTSSLPGARLPQDNSAEETPPTDPQENMGRNPSRAPESASPARPYFEDGNSEKPVLVQSQQESDYINEADRSGTYTQVSTDEEADQQQTIVTSQTSSSSSSSSSVLNQEFASHPTEEEQAVDYGTASSEPGKSPFVGAASAGRPWWEEKPTWEE